MMHVTTHLTLSLTRQSCVDPGLLQNLQPVFSIHHKIIWAAVASSVSVTFFLTGGVSPHAQPPAILEGQCFLSGFSP
jgi:hypothetical protein